MAADNPHSAAAGAVDLAPIVILLAAAVVAVPLFKRMGLGSVLGYLAAGLVIGPFGLKLFSDPQSILHVAELGVVMFLFIIGMLAAVLAWQGAYHVTNLASSIAAIAPTMVGVWLGQHARRRLSAETFRKAFVFGMFAVGLHMARGLL